MTYQEVLEKARTCMGPHCKSCPTCNGLGCRNTIPGPGAKGIGTGFIRNYQKWQELCVNMDTICENKPVDTAFELSSGRRWTSLSSPRRWAPCSSITATSMTTWPTTTS